MEETFNMYEILFVDAFIIKCFRRCKVGNYINNSNSQKNEEFERRKMYIPTTIHPELDNCVE